MNCMFYNFWINRIKTTAFFNYTVYFLLISMLQLVLSKAGNTLECVCVGVCVCVRVCVGVRKLPVVLLQRNTLAAFALASKNALRCVASESNMYLFNAAQDKTQG